MCDPFDLIHNNKITIEEASRKSFCSFCNKKIYNKDLIASNTQNSSFQKLRYHLQCFSPLFDTPIKNDQVLICVNETLNKNRVDNWLKNWNWAKRSQDPLLNRDSRTMPRKLPFKEAKGDLISVLGRYNTIHILIFLTIDEIIQIMKLVSQSFYELCWNPNLWKKLCYRDFTKKATRDLKKKKKQNIVWIDEYFKLQKSTCFFCKSRDGFDLKSCPIEKKPICHKCRLLPGFKLLTLDDIKTKYGMVLWHIFDNFINKYALTCLGDKVFYKKDVDIALKAYQNFDSK